MIKGSQVRHAAHPVDRIFVFDSLKMYRKRSELCFELPQSP